MQLLVAVRVLGRSLRKFSPEKIFSSPACFEEIWPSADREWRDDALLLVCKVLFLNTRCTATWRAATTAQGQFVAARTYRWCCRRLEVCWWRPFVVTAARRLTIDELCLGILPSCKWVCVALVCDLTMVSGRLSSVTLAMTHKYCWTHHMHAIPVVLKVAHTDLCSSYTSYQKPVIQLGRIFIFFPECSSASQAKSKDVSPAQDEQENCWRFDCPVVSSHPSTWSHSHCNSSLAGDSHNYYMHLVILLAINFVLFIFILH